MKLMPEILLHPNIPKPLHGINPRTIKGKSWWDRVRKQAYAARDFTCWACGVHKTDAKFHRWLEGHEIYEFDYQRGRVTFKSLCALCHACHNYIHDGRMQMLVAMKRMTADKQASVLAHGEAVLRAAGFTRFRPKYPDGPEVPWGQWHMVIDGVEYYSCFSGYDEWMDYYQVHGGKGKLTPRLNPIESSGTLSVTARDLSDPQQLRKALDEKLGRVHPSTLPIIRPNSDIGAILNRLHDIEAKHDYDLSPDITLDLLF